MTGARGGTIGGGTDARGLVCEERTPPGASMGGCFFGAAHKLTPQSPKTGISASDEFPLARPHRPLVTMRKSSSCHCGPAHLELAASSWSDANLAVTESVSADFHSPNWNKLFPEFPPGAVQHCQKLEGALPRGSFNWKSHFPLSRTRKHDDAPAKSSVLCAQGFVFSTQAVNRDHWQAPLEPHITMDSLNTLMVSRAP